MIGLVDADFIKYLVAYDIERMYKKGLKPNILIPYATVAALTQDRVNNVFKDVESITNTLIFLFSGRTRDNVRNKIATYKQYKGTRKYAQKYDNEEEYKSWVEEYIKDNYEYHKEDELEADDLCTMAHIRGKTFIYSKDKDLRNSPGFHFDFTTKSLVTVDDFEGLISLLKQAITGDSVDNIPGANNVGPVAAKKALKEAKTSLEAIVATIELFLNQPGSDKNNFDRFIEMYSLVNLRTSEGDWIKEKYKDYFTKINKLISNDEGECNLI